MAPVGQTAALAAVDAFRFRKLPVKGRGYHRNVEPRLTKSMAPHAGSRCTCGRSRRRDAFVHIPDNGGRGVVDMVGRLFLKQRISLKAEPAGQGLGWHFWFFSQMVQSRRGRPAEAPGSFPVVVQLGRIGADNHFILGRCGARAMTLSLVVLHHAHTASAVNGKIQYSSRRWGCGSRRSDR